MPTISPTPSFLLSSAVEEEDGAGVDVGAEEDVDMAVDGADSVAAVADDAVPVADRLAIQMSRE